ncbi:MAG: putative lipid II flippase FtsW [Firmicutes bacterium]|nr:putative lipid II flippase FtsW [Bacillota bacterium]
MDGGGLSLTGRRASPGRSPDLVLFGTTLALLVIGIVTVFSASYTTGLREFGDPYYYVKRQILWAALGVIALVIVMHVDYRVWRRWSVAGLLLAVLLLGLVLVIGTEAGGGRRWIRVGPLSMQPSELAKLAVVNFLAAYIAAQGGGIRRLFQGFLFPMAVVGFIFLLILAERDFGTSVALGLNAVVMLFAAGAQLWHLGLIALVAVPGLFLLIYLEPYRMRRITSFLNPWADPLGAGWNIIQSLYAIGSGGLFGLGLGAGRQKFAYLPEQHTDFIYAVLGEEMGFLGTATVALLFFVFAWRGYRTALRAPDLYGAMLAVGLTSMIVLQAFINMGVVTGSMPVTGITLPFISAGGSSLLVTLAAIGVLLNVSRAAEEGRPGS